MFRALLLLTLFHAAMAAAEEPAPAAAPPAAKLRVAISQGLVNKGPWAVLEAAFTKETGIIIETVPCRGPDVVSTLRTGTVDAGVMHDLPAAGDLIKEGIIKEVIPWASSGYTLVGPAADPAQVRGLRDGASALGRIMRARQPMVRAGGQATRQLLDDFLQHPDNIAGSASWEFLPPGPDALDTAAKAGAYLLLPLQEAQPDVLKKLQLAVMVEGDPAMRRDFVAALSLKSSLPTQGRALLDFLTSPATARLLQSTAAANTYPMPLSPVRSPPGR